MRCLNMTLLLAVSWALIGCERSSDKPATTTSKPATSPSKPQDDQVAHSGHGAEAVELGSATIGAFNVRASRDKGEIKPGGDAPIDVWIDNGVGKGVTAVRFWIGTQDAKGSIKAKADIEDGKWHTHVEIPSPMPEGSKLWVEIEGSDAKKSAVSFDLKI
jgi:hypothetical protein